MATHGDIRRRTIMLFVLGIGLPSTLLGYLAFRGIRNDQALLERERRDDLRGTLDAVVASHDSTLRALSQQFDSVLADTSNLQPPRIHRFLSTKDLIESAFRLGPGDSITVVAPALLYYAHTPPPVGTQTPVRSRLLDRGRRQEFAGEDPDAALDLYRRVLATDAEPSVLAEALSNIARLERARGNLAAAGEAYRELASKYGQVPTAGGFPFREAAQLELATVRYLAGDPTGAAYTLLDLYARHLSGEVPLSKPQYTFLAGRLRGRIDTIIATLTPEPTRFAVEDSLAALSAVEARLRDRTERILTFAQRAGAVLRARRARSSAGSSGHARLSLDIGDYGYHVLLSRPVDDGVGPASWGLLLDPDALLAHITRALDHYLTPESVEWSISTSTGATIQASAADLSQVPTVSTGFPDGVPPLTVGLYPPATGFMSTFLTSRRGVFFYAFLLLAGILGFGLVLTVNTVTHQLELARMQSDFVSTVSHEFRTPLTAIRQIGEMLQSDQVPSDTKRRRYYDLLVEQSERLSLLVNRVLDFARMDSGQHTFDRKAVELGPFLHDVVSRVEQRVDHEGFALRREIADDLPCLPVDVDALGQAVTNLIDNGIKYSGDSRELVVRGYVENGDAVIAVQDFGIGIEPKERPRVFERFYRSGDPLTRAVKGTGLGLTLVKRIVEGHGGRVHAESEPGRGSTFSISIPIQVTHE